MTNLMFLALLPGILIIIFIYRKDKVEHESIGLIVKLMAFGAFSCLPAMYMESFVEGVAPAYMPGTLEYALVNAFLSAAICEELVKFAFLKMGSWKSREFNYRFDGIVYGVSVAVGFALFENVLYVLDGGISVAITRGILAVPLHSFCGVFMGIFYGAAKKAEINRQRGKRRGYLLMAYIIPVLIHGFYDTMCFLATDISSIALLVFVAFMYIISIRKVNEYSRDDWKAAFYRNNDTLDGGHYI